MDLEKYGPWALIVGASEGVGAEMARKLAADGFKLALVARKLEPMQALAEELGAGGTEVRVASVDLSKPDPLGEVRKLTDDVEIGLLAYVAGANNTRGAFVDLDPAVYRSVIAINVTGQTEFAHHYGALMKGRGRGGIILTGSMGGYLGSPTLAPYCAAKAFSRIFTEALWGECTAFGVDVLHLNIGFTATPAMARLGMDISVAEPPANVAQQGLDNIANGPVHIVDTKGNWERVKAVSKLEDRGAVVRQFAIPPREDSAKAQLKQMADVDAASE
jgi:short-subunit dehydrogenase